MAKKKIDERILPKIGSRELSKHLREVLAEIREHRLNEITEEIEAVSNARALAELMVRRALGGVEVEIAEGEKGEPVQRRIYRKPEMAAAAFVWERVEGKTPAAAADEKSGITAADKVEELARKRLNAMADAAVAPAAPPATQMESDDA